MLNIKNSFSAVLVGDTWLASKFEFSIPGTQSHTLSLLLCWVGELVCWLVVRAGTDKVTKRADSITCDGDSSNDDDGGKQNHYGKCVIIMHRN